MIYQAKVNLGSLQPDNLRWQWSKSYLTTLLQLDNWVNKPKGPQNYKIKVFFPRGKPFHVQEEQDGGKKILNRPTDRRRRTFP